MKLLTLIPLVLSLLVSATRAQGLVAFANDPSSLVYCMRGAAAIMGVAPGAPLPKAWGPAIKAELGIAYSSYSFTPIAQTYFSRFADGRLAGKVAEVPGVPGGGYVWLQVRVWEEAYGATYEEAMATLLNGRAPILGESERFWIQTGVVVPTPIYLDGLQSFYVGPLSEPYVPEPSTWMLGTAGAAGLLLWRTRARRVFRVANARRDELGSSAGSGD